MTTIVIPSSYCIMYEVLSILSRLLLLTSVIRIKWLFTCWEVVGLLYVDYIAIRSCGRSPSFLLVSSFFEQCIFNFPILICFIIKDDSISILQIMLLSSFNRSFATIDIGYFNLREAKARLDSCRVTSFKNAIYLFTKSLSNISQ